jgi:Holliday junction resolvase-like predicted endonuclease
MDGLKFLSTQQQRLAFIQHHKNMGYVKGQPDLVAISNNKVFFIELKTQKGKQSKEQKEVEQEIKKRGMDYIVVRSLEDIREYLKK